MSGASTTDPMNRGQRFLGQVVGICLQRNFRTLVSVTWTDGCAYREAWKEDPFSTAAPGGKPYLLVLGGHSNPTLSGNNYSKGRPDHCLLMIISIKLYHKYGVLARKILSVSHGGGKIYKTPSCLPQEDMGGINVELLSNWRKGKGGEYGEQ